MEDDSVHADLDDLLVPEVSMNIDDAPIELHENEDQEKEIPTSEQNGDVAEVVEDGDEAKSTSDKIAHVVDDANQENKNPDQVPAVYTLEEANVYEELFGTGKQAVQFQRVHCTACNVHLGSAPNKRFKRFIHPLLKVLICKNCFSFYGSGDFDKDEDGSELYCRWCGQGGKVLCCAQCPYVFCQRCIRTNLGKKKLDTVKESDDWMCFVCEPEQIVTTRVSCRALYDFVQEEFRLATELKQPERLAIDSSLCCINRLKNPVAKRKRSSSTDRPYIVGLDEDDDSFRKKKKIKHNILSQMLSNENNPPSKKVYIPSLAAKAWQSQIEDEVVCTPDLSLLMEDEESSLQTPNASPQPSPQPSSSNLLDDPLGLLQPIALPITPLSQFQNDFNFNATKDSDVQFVGQTRLVNFANRSKPTDFGYTLPSKPPPLVLYTSTKKPLTANKKPIGPNLVKLQAQPIRFQARSNAASQPMMTVSHNHNSSVIDTSVPAQLAPGLRYEWFEKATQFTAKVNQNLSTRLCTLSKEQSSVSSLEGLAGIHNSLQEMLSNSINTLMQIRKNLRSDFIAGLKKLQFCKGSESSAQTVSDDNDVIIVDSHTPTSIAPDVGSSEFKPRAYIKVKPPSELMDSPIITIPDDNVSSDVIPVDDAPNKAEQNENATTDQNESSYNTNEALSEISEVLNPETVLLIKRALWESKFETVLNDNLKVGVRDVPPELLRAMLRVRVVVETNFGPGMPITRPRRGYKAMNIAPAYEQDIEQIICSSVVVNAKRKAFDDSFSAFVASRAQQSQEGELENESSKCVNENHDETSADLPDELRGAIEVNSLNKSAPDLQTTDSGIDVDGEQSLSNGIASCQDN